MELLKYGVSIHFFDDKGWEFVRTMKLLAGRTVAVLRVQRFLPTQLVTDFTAMTASLIASVKVWVVVVDLVGCPVLPLVVLAFRVSPIAIVAVTTVCRCLLGHDFSVDVELKCIGARNGSRCWNEGAWCKVELK